MAKLKVNKTKKDEIALLSRLEPYRFWSKLTAINKLRQTELYLKVYKDLRILCNFGIVFAKAPCFRLVN